jgi:heptosyltransferase-3
VRPNPTLIILKMIKRGITDIRLIPHLMAILLSFIRNYVKLRWWRPNGKQSLAIALIEHMGDIIAAEPMSRLARRDHPDAAIAWILRKPYRDVVGNFPSIDKLFTVNCMTEWLLLWGAHTTDRVWDLHISERTCYKCNITFKKQGSPGRLTYKSYYNFGNLLAVNCLSADLPVINDAPRIIPDDAAIHAVDDLALPQQIIVIHCRSNEERRDWLLEKWTVLIEWITGQTGFTVCEIGSQPYAVQHATPTTRSLCGALSILETAEVIRRAALFIGIDSGPAHLANATGTPGIVLLGSYADFETYTPYSAGYADGTLADLVRSNGPAANIDVESVIARISQRLKITQRNRTDSHPSSIETGTELRDELKW